MKKMAPDRGSNRSKFAPGVHTKGKGKKSQQNRDATLKQKIRSIERLMNRDILPKEAREAQEKHLKELRDMYAKKKPVIQPVKKKNKKQQLYKQVKFIERMKIERGIKRLEKQVGNADDEETKQQSEKKLVQLKEDLEYVRFFPKTEKYISLFKEGNDAAAASRRQKIRDLIKSNLAEAAAAGVELEETMEPAPTEDFVPDPEDDFFAEVDTDDETANLLKSGTDIAEPQRMNHDSEEQIEATTSKRKRNRKRPKKHK